MCKSVGKSGCCLKFFPFSVENFIKFKLQLLFLTYNPYKINRNFINIRLIHNLSRFWG